MQYPTGVKLRENQGNAGNAGNDGAPTRPVFRQRGFSSQRTQPRRGSAQCDDCRQGDGIPGVHVQPRVKRVARAHRPIVPREARARDNHGRRLYGRRLDEGYWRFRACKLQRGRCEAAQARRKQDWQHTRAKHALRKAGEDAQAVLRQGVR